jgi:two-component system, LytTR family, response regulator
MTLTALIVDDERLARAELRSLLIAHPSIDVAAEAATVQAATSALTHTPFDVVFLDIQLGSRSGFEVLGAIQAATRIVFVTAFDAHAVRAFEVNALDYLLKPVHPDRLAASIARLHLPPPRPPLTPRLTPDSVVYLGSGSASAFTRVTTIACILADGDYTRVVTTDGREMLMLRSLAEWEQRLPVETFARIHRSAIANVALVAHTKRGRDGRWRLHLPPLSRPLVVSRRYARRLRQTQR